MQNLKEKKVPTTTNWLIRARRRLRLSGGCWGVSTFVLVSAGVWGVWIRGYFCVCVFFFFSFYSFFFPLFFGNKRVLLEIALKIFLCLQQKKKCWNIKSRYDPYSFVYNFLSILELKIMGYNVYSSLSPPIGKRRTILYNQNI